MIDRFLLFDSAEDKFQNKFCFISTTYLVIIFSSDNFFFCEVMFLKYYFFGLIIFVDIYA